MIVGIEDILKDVHIGDAEREYKRVHPDRAIFKVAGKCVLDDETLLEHCRIAMRQGFPEITKPQDPYYSTPLIVVGAGLSVEPYLEEIRERSKTLPILALKGAHNWLRSHGITPTFACALDPQQSRARCFTNLNDETVYLLSSTMHPDTWEHMRGRRVMLFHQFFCQQQRDMEEWVGKTMLAGGCTTGMRALPMMFFCGFRNFELYGFDSSVRDDGTYKLEGYKANDEIVPVFVGEQRYLTTVTLYAQVQDMQGVFATMPSCKVNAYGDGLFQAVLNEGKAKGWPI